MLCGCGDGVVWKFGNEFGGERFGFFWIGRLDKFDNGSEGVGFTGVEGVSGDRFEEVNLEFGVDGGNSVGIFEAADGADCWESGLLVEDFERLSEFFWGGFGKKFIDGFLALLWFAEFMEGLDPLPLSGSVLGLFFEDGFGGGECCGGSSEVHFFENFMSVLVASVAESAKDESKRKSGEESSEVCPVACSSTDLLTELEE